VSPDPYLCGLRFRGGQPRPRFPVIVTPPIGRTHNEQVCLRSALREQTSPQALKAFSAYSARSNPWAQNSSNRPSSSRTSKATCSGCPKRCSITPNFPRRSSLLSVSKTLTLVPIRASCSCKELPRIA
jgi:hypothetical protein